MTATLIAMMLFAASPFADCDICNGKGRVATELDCKSCKSTMKIRCGRCHGSGSIKCKSCGGDGRTSIKTTEYGGSEHHRIEPCSVCTREQIVHDFSGRIVKVRTVGREVCTTCGGQKQIECNRCDGGHITRFLPCKACGGAGDGDADEGGGELADLEERDISEGGIQVVRREAGRELRARSVQVKGPYTLNLDPDGDRLVVRSDPRTGALHIEWDDNGKLRRLEVEPAGRSEWKAVVKQEK